MVASLVAALALGLAPVPVGEEGGPSQAVQASSPVVHHRTIEADGLKIFYRESGPKDAPVVLLLHGFPTSSHMYRDLIPQLAGRYRVIAPDLPGFGFSEAPARGTYPYTFDALAQTVERFTDALGLDRYALYVFDYGAPVGLRLAMSRPERVTALISQNGNAYEEGLSSGWEPLQRYWREPTPAHRDALRQILTLESTQWQYTHGSPDPSVIAPETWTLDQSLLDRPGMTEIQLDLFADYRSNVALYPHFQAYFRERRPPTLAVWGRNDPYFLPAGAEAFRRDNPDAEVRLVDGGHFALETHLSEISVILLEFLDRTLAASSR